MTDPHHNAQAFGRAVAARRAELGLSRKDLAHSSGLSYSYVANIEAGHKQPSSKALHALAEALQTRPAQLLDRADALGLIPPPDDLASFASGPVLEMRAPGPSWFRGGAEGLAEMRSRPDPDDLRTVVREVLREELAAAPRADAPPAGPPSSSTATPPLDASIRALLPDWLTEPATSPIDLAIQGVVLERLHRLEPGASADEVRREIERALDRITKRAQRYRRGEPLS